MNDPKTFRCPACKAESEIRKQFGASIDLGELGGRDPRAPQVGELRTARPEDLCARHAKMRAIREALSFLEVTAQLLDRMSDQELEQLRTAFLANHCSRCWRRLHVAPGPMLGREICRCEDDS